MEIGDPEGYDAHSESQDEGEFSDSFSQENPSDGKPSPSLPAWQSELAERVQEYRQRRASYGKDDKDGDAGPESLELDFGSADPETEEAPLNVIEFPATEEPESQSQFVSSSSERPDPPSSLLDILELTRQEQDKGVKVPSQSMPKAKPPTETGPLEIEFGPSSSTSSEGIDEAEESGILIAPLGMRFAAGIIDALVLIFGAAVFSLIFWKTGGQFSPRPLELAVAGLIGVFFVFLYFGGCTAVASATPGLIWTGLEIRTFEGNSPRLSECFWRAFGYLVSASALMLGFIWSVVDADGLTWHDRMSRTFLTPTNRS